MKETREVLFEILSSGFRLLVRHWPKLFAIFLLGAIARSVSLWLAVAASKVDPFLGQLVLPLAPTSMLIALIIMIHVTKGEENSVRDAVETTTGLLIPFLAVYAAQGLLKADVLRFVQDVVSEEWLKQSTEFGFSRVNLPDTWVVGLLIVMALVARTVISGLGLPAKSLTWTMIGGYIEAFWLVSLGFVLSMRLDDMTEWIMSRTVVVEFFAWFTSSQSGLVDAIGRGAALQAWSEAFFESAGLLVFIPVAWLAIGATIYGDELPDEFFVKEKSSAVRTAVKFTAFEVLSPVLGPVSKAVESLRRVAVGGVIPMVVFCVLFALLNNVQILLSYGYRWIVGPQAWITHEGLRPFLQLTQDAVYYVLVVPLLAAAVEFVLRRQAAAMQDV